MSQKMIFMELSEFSWRDYRGKLSVSAGEIRLRVYEQVRVRIGRSTGTDNRGKLATIIWLRHYGMFIISTSLLTVDYS